MKNKERKKHIMVRQGYVIDVEGTIDKLLENIEILNRSIDAKLNKLLKPHDPITKQQRT